MVHSRLKRAAALLAAAFVLAAGVTCSDSSTGPKGAPRALVGVAPVFSRAAEDVYRNLVSFELEVNNLRVVLRRANGEIAIDTTVIVAPGQDSVVLSLSVEVDGAQEVFEATIELRDGDVVLFSGTQTVTARVSAGGSPATQPIELEYTGPGAGVTTLDVEPDTTISGLDNIVMRPVARNANNQPITNLNLVWSLAAGSTPNVGSVNGAGVFDPSGSSGTAIISAALPTGVSGSATVIIVSPPSAVVLISGGGQTGAVGSALTPIVVEVRAADGSPVPGHAVSFAITAGGGSLEPATATTNSAGRANVTLTLGTTLGQNSIQVTAAGLTPISVSATATPGAAAKLAMVQQPSANAASGAALATQPSVKLQDAFGNDVSSANVPVTVALTAPGGRTLQGTTTRNTNASGIAEFTDLAITGPAGTTTLTFTQGSLTPATSSSITIGSGVPTTLTATSFLAITDTAGTNVAAAQVPAVSVHDAFDNPVSGVEVKFRRHGGAGSSINAQPDTMVVVSTDANGAAALTGRRLQTLVGFDTVLVTAAGLNDTLRFHATVTHASATNLAFVQQPPNGSVGVVLSPAPSVEVRDQFGNRVTTGPSATATVTVGMGMQDALLSGTTSRAAVAGLATFDDLTLTPQGSYVLHAAVSGLAGATSNPFTISVAGATTRTWVNAAGGDWATASNWSGGVVPGALDTAVIDLAGTYSVIVTTAVTVGKVVVGGASGTAILGVVGPSGSLTLGDSLRVTPTGALSLGGGTGGVVLSGGSVLIQGVASWAGGNITGTNPIVVPPGGTFSISSGGIKTLSGRILSNEGTLLLQGTDADDLVLSDGAAIENGVEAELLIQGDLDILQGSGATGAVSNIFGFVRRLVGDNGTTTIAVPYLNSGSAITEIQAGTLAFSGATLTNTVNATIRGMGTLDVSGVTSFTNAGRIEPGLSPGALTITGNLPMQGSSRLKIELGGLTPGTEYDVLNVSGNASLSGTLEITNVGYTPQAGDSFTILNYASRSFTFASIAGLDLGGGFTLVPTYGVTSLTLTVQGGAGPTISWITPGGGSWNTAANWNLNRVPNSSDVVGIQLAGNYSVTLNVSPTISGLLLGGASGTQTLLGDDRSLIVNGATNIAANGVLGLTVFTLAGSGTVTNHGLVTLDGSSVAPTTTFNNQGLLVISDATTLNGGVITTATSTIRVDGTSSAAVLTVQNGFTNNGLIELTSQGGRASQLIVASGTLVNGNGATIRSAVGEAGGARSMAAQLDNRGTLTVEQALTLSQPSAQHLNSGAINLTGANLTVTLSGTTPSFANTGTIDIGSGRVFTATGGVVTNASGGVIRGTGTLDVSEGATFSNGATVAPNGPGAVGVLVVAGTYAQSAAATLNIELAGTSQYDILTISGAALLGGTLDVSLMDGFEPAVGNSFTVLNYQSHTGAFDNLNLPALNAGLEWDVNVGASSLTLTVQAASGASVSWINESGGLWSLTSNWSTGVLPTVSDVVGFGLAVSNTATLDVSATIAGLELGTGAGVQELSAVAGQVFTINGAVNVHPNGSLVISSSTLNGTGSVTNLGSIGLLSGTVTNVVNNQNFLLAAGGAILGNVLTTSPTSTFLVQEQNAGAAANVTVLQGFTNNGLLEIRSTTGDGTHLTVTNGTLTNAAGAFLRATGLAGGPRSLNAQLANQGTLVAEQALTLTRSSDAAHTNVGTIDLTGANLTLNHTVASSFTNTGTVTIGSSREFTVNNGTFNHEAGATLSGLGTLTLNAVAAANFLTSFSIGALNLSSSAVNLGSGVNLSTAGMALSLSSSTVSGPGTITNVEGQTLTLTGTNVVATSSVNNQGTLMVSGGSQINGPLNATGGSLIRVQADGSTGFASLVVPASGFVNNGAIELTSTTNAFSQFTANSGGTFTNGASGTIAAFAGSGGQRLLGQVDNVGTITVHPGENAGVITVAGNLTTSGTLNIELGGTTPGSSYSRITLTGVLTAGGTLNVSLVNGFVPAEGNGFAILNYASRSGDFGTINLPSLGAGLEWDVDVGASVLTLTVNATSGGFSWVNAAGGNWSTPSNWSGGVVPGPTDIVAIDLAGTYTVTLDVNTTIAELSLGGATGTQTLTVSGRVLTVNGPTSIAESGALILTSSSVNGTGGTITNSGTVVARGTVNVAGAFQNNGGVLRVEVHETAGPAHAIFGAGVANSGTIDMTTSGGPGPSQITVSSGSLTNATDGTIVTSGSGARTITAQLDNQGLLSLGLGLTLDRPDAQHTNSGSITVSDGFTVNMTTGSFTNTASGTVTLNWIWSVNGGTLDIDEGNVSSPSDMFLSVNSATLLSLTPNSVTVPLTIVNTPVSGGISVGTSQTVTLLNSNLLAGTAINVQSGGTLVVRGATTFNGPLTQNGVLRILALGAFDAALTVANGFTNNGLIELTGFQSTAGAQLTVANGTLVNSSDGTISSLNGTFGGPRALTAQLDNQGSLVVEGLTLAKADAAHVNTGTIDLPGRLTVTQTGTAPSFTNNGSIQLSGSGLLLDVNGGAFTNGGGDPPGVITGAGTINLVGTTLTNHGVMEPTGVMSVVGNYTQGPGGTLNSVISSFTQFGQLSVSGIANLAGTLTVFVNDFVPDVHGQNLVLLTSSSPLVGALTPGPLTFNGGHFTVTQNSTQIFVTTVLDGFPTTFWVNTSGGNWNTPSNWSTNAVPTTSDIVGIALATPVTVTLDVNPTIAGLILGGSPGIQTLSGTGRTLTVNGPTAITVNGALSLTTSNIAGTGTIVNQGSLVLQSTPVAATQVLSNLGTMVARGTMAINGQLLATTGSTLTVEGGSLTVANAFTNAGLIVLTSATGATATLTVSNGTLTNAVGGTIQSIQGAGGGGRTLAAQLDNQGTVLVDHQLNLNRPDALHVNFGLFNMNTATLTVTQSAGGALTNIGFIQIPANETMAVNGGTFINGTGSPFGTIQGDGQIQVSATTVINDGAVSPSGILDWVGDYAPNASSVLNIEIRGTTPGSGYDRLAVTGTTTALDGTLNVTFNNFVPTLGQTFDIVSSTGTHTGAFSQTNLPDLSGLGLTWQIDYQADRVILRVVDGQ